MALVLAVKEGESFYIGTVKFLVESIHSPSRVTLKKYGSLDEIITLSGNRSIELMPHVYVFIGLKSSEHSVRLSFEAPRSIIIDREEVYHNGVSI
jgi:sRNA-binding carbon storage regulator CsrA